MFIIDESSSIWPVHFARQRDFIANLTDSFDVGPDQTRIAAVTFADRVKHRFGFNDFKKNEEVRMAIQSIDQKTGGKIFLVMSLAGWVVEGAIAVSNRQIASS